MTVKEKLLMCGFEDLKQYCSLLKRINLEDPCKRAVFEKWNTTNGTKAELLRLFPHLKEQTEEPMDSLQLQPSAAHEGTEAYTKSKYSYYTFYLFEEGFLVYRYTSNEKVLKEDVLYITEGKIYANEEEISLETLSFYKAGEDMPVEKFLVIQHLFCQPYSDEISNVLSQLFNEIIKEKGQQIKSTGYLAYCIGESNEEDIHPVATIIDVERGR